MSDLNFNIQNVVKNHEDGRDVRNIPTFGRESGNSRKLIKTTEKYLAWVEHGWAQLFLVEHGRNISCLRQSWSNNVETRFAWFEHSRAFFGWARSKHIHIRLRWPKETKFWSKWEKYYELLIETPDTKQFAVCSHYFFKIKDFLQIFTF